MLKELQAFQTMKDGITGLEEDRDILKVLLEKLDASLTDARLNKVGKSRSTAVKQLVEFQDSVISKLNLKTEDELLPQIDLVAKDQLNFAAMKMAESAVLQACGETSLDALTSKIDKLTQDLSNLQQQFDDAQKEVSRLVPYETCTKYVVDKLNLPEMSVNSFKARYDLDFDRLKYVVDSLNLQGDMSVEVFKTRYQLNFDSLSLLRDLTGATSNELIPRKVESLRKEKEKLEEGICSKGHTLVRYSTGTETRKREDKQSHKRKGSM